MNDNVRTLRVSAFVPAEQVRYLQRVMGIRPKHRSYAPVDANMSEETHPPAHVGGEVELFELDAPLEAPIELGRFLVDERGWPPVFAVRNVDLFAAAVLRRYIRVLGHEPQWDRGYVYRGATDYMIISDCYDEEMGALAEQIASDVHS